MSKDNQAWENILEGWDSFPIEAYELALSESKENFEELATDSENITDKSIRILILSISSSIGFTIYLLESSQNIGYYLFIPLLLFGVICIQSIKLMFPKQIIPRGTKPEHIMLNIYDNYDNEKSKLNALYYNTIRQYNKAINDFEELLRSRHDSYSLLLITLGMYFTSIIIILSFLVY